MRLMHCHDLNTSTKHIGLVNEQDNKAHNNLALTVAIDKQT